jgi:hypothetical protein
MSSLAQLWVLYSRFEKKWRISAILLRGENFSSPDVLKDKAVSVTLK